MPGVPLEKLAKGPEFKDKFNKKFGVDIQLYAPYVYDAVMVMADSMQRANSVEPGKYLPEVGKSKYDGVTGVIEFDEFGDVKGGAISMYQYKGGKLEYVETLGGGMVAAVKDAAQATGDAAKTAATAVADAGKDVAKEAAKVGGEVKEAAKAGAEAVKGAVEKK